MMHAFRSIMIGTLLAFGFAAAQGSTHASVQAATWHLGATLVVGLDALPTPDVVAAFGALRTSVVAAGDPGLDPLVQPIEAVEQAFTAEPFDPSALATALGTLALALRSAAEQGGPLLLTELASLVDQTSGVVEADGFVPRMDVDTD